MDILDPRDAVASAASAALAAPEQADEDHKMRVLDNRGRPCKLDFFPSPDGS